MQTDNPDPLLTSYRRLVHQRNAHPALRTGTYQPLDSSCRGVYAPLRVSDQERLLTLINLGKYEANDCVLSLGGSTLSNSYRLTPLLGMPRIDALTFGDNGSLPEFTVGAVLDCSESWVAALKK